MASLWFSTVFVTSRCLPLHFVCSICLGQHEIQVLKKYRLFLLAKYISFPFYTRFILTEIFLSSTSQNFWQRSNEIFFEKVDKGKVPGADFGDYGLNDVIHPLTYPVGLAVTTYICTELWTRRSSLGNRCVCVWWQLNHAISIGMCRPRRTVKRGSYPQTEREGWGVPS